MIIGLLLIVFGLLIAMFPQILVALFAATLILMGIGLCAASVQWHRVRRERSFFHWIMRF